MRCVVWMIQNLAYSKVMGEEIRSGTVLPAEREEIVFTTADGIELVGELALPASGRIRATLVTLHPLPTHGGFMDSHIFRKASYRLPALADIAVLRFNTRGTSSPRGTSGGHFDEGEGERFDLAAAVDFAVARELPNRWLLGWSFGTELVLRYGADTDTLGGVLLSPPLHRAGEQDMQHWAQTAKPLTVLVPEFDDYLQPDQARVRFAAAPEAELKGIAGAKHLWVGEKYVQIVLNEIVARVAPGVDIPLPVEWPASVH